MNEDKPRVLVDVDGVMADFNKAAIATANQLFGTAYEAKNVNEWSVARYMKLTKEQEDAFYFELHKPGWASSLEPYPGAKEGIRELREHADVHIVTSPVFSATWCGDRWQWLKGHFEIPSRDVTHTHQKHLVSGEVIVDDKPSNVRRWATEHPEGAAFLWLQKYNMHETDKRLKYATTWEDVISYTKGLRNG